MAKKKPEHKTEAPKQERVIAKSLEIKLARPHPAQKMKLQEHVVTQVFQKFDVTEEELAELQTEGGKHWFVFKEV